MREYASFAALSPRSAPRSQPAPTPHRGATAASSSTRCLDPLISTSTCRKQRGAIGSASGASQQSTGRLARLVTGRGRSVDASGQRGAAARAGELVRGTLESSNRRPPCSDAVNNCRLNDIIVIRPTRSRDGDGFVRTLSSSGKNFFALHTVNQPRPRSSEANRFLEVSFLLGDLNLRSFGTRLDQDLIDQIKIRAVQRRMSLQDIADEAFRVWLDTQPKSAGL